MTTSSKPATHWTCLGPAARGLYAQSQAMNGVIQGTVRGDNGMGLGGVEVGLRNQDNGAIRRVRTDTAGRYRAPLLPLGSYEIAAEREGFIGARQTGVALELGQALTVNFSLMRSLTSAQTVSVVSKAPVVEGDRKQPSTTINRKFVEDLPVYGRKFMDLGVMVPGATEFGDRDTSATADFVGVNHFYSNAIVDGTNAYQAWSGLPNGKFVVPFEFSQSAIQEFQVLNGNFTAEFGRSAAGLITAVTKSGTNQLHGDGSYFFSDSAMNATPRFAFRKPKTRQQEFGGSLGGPLVRDRLFLFGNYDDQILGEPLIVTPGTALDGADATLASITNADERQRFIQARDFVKSLTGDFHRDLNQYTGLLKTDWRPNTTQALSARFNYQHFNGTNLPDNAFTAPIITGFALSNAGIVRVENSSLALQWSASLSPQTLNEARMLFALGKEWQIPNGVGPQVRIGGVKAGGFGFGRRDVFPSFLREQRWQWVDNMTFIRGAHEIKAGVDIDRAFDRNVGISAADGSYQFNSLRDFANGRYMMYTQGLGVPESRTITPYYGAFIQDNVKLASTLSMNIGLRYEFQKLTPSPLPNPEFPRTAQVHQDKDNFAPRLALAWQPQPKLALRASYGIYYGPLSVKANAGVETQNGVFQRLRQFRGSTLAGAPVYPQVFPRDTQPQIPAAGADIIVFSPNFAGAYIQQTNLEVEREVASDLTVTAGWIYTKGTRLRSDEDMNLFAPGSRTIEIRDAARNISGFFAVPYFGGPSSRPFPFFNQISEFRSDNSSVYHAFFVQLNKRYGHGLQFLFNYALSKLTDANPAPGNQTTCCTSDNPFHRDERGLGTRDQRHRINFANVWDLPTPPVEARLPKSMLEGWRISTIIKAGTGRPFDPTVTGDSGGDVTGDGIRGDRAPLFGRNSFTGPGYSTVDLSLRKLLYSREGKNVDFTFAAFNALNRTNYLLPNTDYYTMTNLTGGVSRLDGPLPSFGKPTDATSSRQLQASIKFYF